VPASGLTLPVLILTWPEWRVQREGWPCKQRWKSGTNSWDDLRSLLNGWINVFVTSLSGCTVVLQASGRSSSVQTSGFSWLGKVGRGQYLPSKTYLALRYLCKLGNVEPRGVAGLIVSRVKWRNRVLRCLYLQN
jgi:hypothetical protein